MNATLEPIFRHNPGCFQTGFVAATSIKVVFKSDFSFEPLIKKYMNAISLSRKPAPAAASDNSQRLVSGSETNLKNMEGGVTGAVTEWIVPPEMEGERKDHYETDIFDASLRALNHRKRTDNSMPALKLVEFSLEVPAAKTVQLAADFTDWEEAPLDMVRFSGGTWSTTVPLPAGIYAYRFLVDGAWYDDPLAVRRTPGSTGLSQTFVKVN